MTSFLDRLKARAAGQKVVGGNQYAPPPNAQRHRNVIKNVNRWDSKTYAEVRKTESVDTFIEDLMDGDEFKGGSRKEFEGAPELVEGLFHSFHKAAPQLAGKRELERELYPVRKILEEVQGNPKLKELQEFTVNDTVTSTIAIDAMQDTIREILERMPPPPQPGGGGGGGCQGGGSQPGDQPGGGGGGGGQGGDDEGDQPSGGGGGGQGQPSDQEGDEGNPDPTGGPDQGQEFDPDSEDAEDQAETDWENQFDDLLDDLDLDRMANKMLDQAMDEAQELEGLRKGIGLEDGEWKQMSPEERLAMAERLRTPEMKELSMVIGQMKRFALGVKATRINDVPHEAYDVEMGNDLRRVLRAQYALLGTPETKYEFYRRYVDKELLQYKMRGTEEVGQGPIVVAIDKSGSMGGSPFNWAMGVAEALRRFSADEDRDFFAMFFGNNNDRNRFDFPGGKGPFEKVLAFLSVVANGGTQFDGVLTEALEKASKHFDKTGKGKADIVFITDGMAHLDDAWIKSFNEERERVGVRVYSVYIGGAYDMGGRGGPVGLLESISDAVIPVKELKPESVREIFQRV